MLTEYTPAFRAMWLKDLEAIRRGSYRVPPPRLTRAEAQRASQDSEILRLRALGWSAREIGLSVNLSKGAVYWRLQQLGAK